MDKRIRPIKSFNKMLTVPPDKSITHRACLFGAIAEGKTEIINPLFSEDCLTTLDCIKKLGAGVSLSGGRISIVGAKEFKSTSLYAGNSGTTARLISGILASESGKTFTLDGDASLKKRPMNRIIDPLTLMGAKFISESNKLPMQIVGENLSGIDYKMPLASAQVKSAILLAGINADGETIVREEIKSRDHTEIMLKAFGGNISVSGNDITVKKSKLKGVSFEVCGDISSAAFPLVMAACKKDSKVIVKNVGINPTRTGILKVFERCGANLRIFNEKNICGELVCDIELVYSALKPFTIDKNQVPSLIDEIPILAVLGCFIEGISVITGAEELKVKESNRIDSVVSALTLLGASVKATSDGMIIEGHGSLSGGATIESNGDHRIAMSMAIAAALSLSGGFIKDADCANISYPDFFEMLEC